MAITREDSVMSLVVVAGIEDSARSLVGVGEDDSKAGAEDSEKIEE